MCSGPFMKNVTPIGVIVTEISVTRQIHTKIHTITPYQTKRIGPIALRLSIDKSVSNDNALTGGIIPLAAECEIVAERHSLRLMLSSLRLAV